MIPKLDCPENASYIDVVKSAFDADGKELELRKTECHDCAVKTGFYKNYSDALKSLSKEEQIKHAKKWFCHNNCDKACKGNANNLDIKW